MLRLLSLLSCEKPNLVNSAASQGNVIQHGRLALSRVTMAGSDSMWCLCPCKLVSPLPQKDWAKRTRNASVFVFTTALRYISMFVQGDGKQ